MDITLRSFLELALLFFKPLINFPKSILIHELRDFVTSIALQ